MGRLRGSKDLSVDLKQKIIDVVGTGLKQTKVAAYYKVPVGTVKTILRRDRLLNNDFIKKKMGRKCKLGPRSVRCLLIYVQKNYKMPLYAIAMNFRASNGAQLSKRTVRRYLHKNGAFSFVAARKPYLSKKNVPARLNWV